MRIELEFFENEEGTNYCQVIRSINDKGIKNRVIQSIFEDCPEDAYFYRDLNGPESYIDIIKMAYQAGKDGEELEILYIETKDE